jgi:hypothetical protein
MSLARIHRPSAQLGFHAGRIEEQIRLPSQEHSSVRAKNQVQESLPGEPAVKKLDVDVMLESIELFLAV